MRAARWTSIALHPFVTTLVLAGAVELGRGAVSAARTVAVVGILFVLPVAVLTMVQRRRGAWSTVDASRPHERPILFLVGAAGLVAMVLAWRGLPIGWVLAALLPALAWSRIELGRHRLVEVVLGMAIGAIAGALIVHFT